MNKNKQIVLIALPIIVLVSIFGFYYYVAMGFGKGVAEMSEGIYKANKDWESRKENPIDSIKNSCWCERHTRTQ